MERPIDVLRQVQTMLSTPPKQTRVGWYLGFAIAAVIAIPVIKVVGLVDYIRHLRWMGDLRYALMLLSIPVVIVGALLGAWIDGWIHRPTVPFDSPLVMRLPGFYLWSNHDPECVYLARRRTLVCLFMRTAGPMDVGSVLRSLFPDDGVQMLSETENACTFDLVGTAKAIGRLRKLPAPGAYALMLASDSFLANDTAPKLDMGRFRTPGEGPQRWCPMPKATVPAARVRR